MTPSFIRKSKSQRLTPNPNRSSQNQRLHFEEVSWQQRQMTGTMANASEYLRSHITDGSAAPSEPLHVSNVIVLATNIIGSSRYYAQKGDLKAYQLQDRIRNFQRTILDRYDGAIFQYMGNNILATFTSYKAAIDAAFAIRQEFEIFNSTLPDNEQVSMKIAFHNGSCLAYNLSNLTGYFGITINTAQKIAQTCNDNGFAMSQDFYNNPDVQKVMKSYEDEVHIQEIDNSDGSDDTETDGLEFVEAALKSEVMSS